MTLCPPQCPDPETPRRAVRQRAGVLADERALAQLASKLQEIERRSPKLGFVVYGYADGSGRPERNLTLATTRADWAAPCW